MRGRKPLPTHLKVVTGNPGGRPLNHAEPRPELVAPTPPKHLAGEALKEWKRISPQLLELGLLTRVDRAALAMYCTQYARYVRAELEMERQYKLYLAAPEAGLIEATPQGYRMQSVWLQISNKAQEQCLKFLTEFGMSPSARSRVQTSAQLPLPGVGDADTNRKWNSL